MSEVELIRVDSVTVVSRPKVPAPAPEPQAESAPAPKPAPKPAKKQA